MNSIDYEFSLYPSLYKEWRALTDFDRKQLIEGLRSALEQQPKNEQPNDLIN